MKACFFVSEETSEPPARWWSGLVTCFGVMQQRELSEEEEDEEPRTNEHLDKYWIRHYLLAGGCETMCGLCDLGYVTLKDGRKAPCFCPNGQCIAKTEFEKGIA